MRFLADECCSATLVEALREDGHDVLFMIEHDPGASDARVLQRAFDENRLLLTEDKDFGELVYRLRRPARGVVLLRFAPSERKRKLPRLEDAFVVLEADKTRFRPLNPS